MSKGPADKEGNGAGDAGTPTSLKCLGCVAAEGSPRRRRSQDTHCCKRQHTARMQQEENPLPTRRQHILSRALIPKNQPPTRRRRASSPPFVTCASPAHHGACTGVQDAFKSISRPLISMSNSVRPRAHRPSLRHCGCGLLDWAQNNRTPARAQANPPAMPRPAQPWWRRPDKMGDAQRGKKARYAYCAWPRARDFFVVVLCHTVCRSPQFVCRSSPGESSPFVCRIRLSD